MSKFISFLVGLLTGAAVGALLALLFAPMSGQDLRAQAQSQTGKVIKSVRDAVAEERKRLEEELEALKRGEIQLT